MQQLWNKADLVGMKLFRPLDVIDIARQCELVTHYNDVGQCELATTY